MRIIKSICIAFSIYSKIPMPQFAWEEEDMKYMMCFFPWIGAVIGLLLYGWFCVSEHLGVGILCHTMIGAAIPLLVTGGFHMDGFMDTMDAFHSYRSRERKLEILKDPHIGAFSVLMLALYGLVFLGAFSEIYDRNLQMIVCAGFFLARALSGIAVVTFKSAKHEGLLFTFASGSHKIRVRMVLYLECFCAVIFIVKQSLIYGLLIIASAFGTFFYYKWKTSKELGGITGDTAGYFVALCELSMIVTAAVIHILQ